MVVFFCSHIFIIRQLKSSKNAQNLRFHFNFILCFCGCSKFLKVLLQSQVPDCTVIPRLFKSWKTQFDLSAVHEIYRTFNHVAYSRKRPRRVCKLEISIKLKMFFESWKVKNERNNPFECIGNTVQLICQSPKPNHATRQIFFFVDWKCELGRHDVYLYICMRIFTFIFMSTYLPIWSLLVYPLPTQLACFFHANPSPHNKRTAMIRNWASSGCWRGTFN